VAILAHKVFDGKATKEIINQIVRDSCNAINYVDGKRRIALCGKSKNGILSGLFYWFSIRYQCQITQRNIADNLPAKIVHFKHEFLGIKETFTETSVRNSISFWKHNFPELIQNEIGLAPHGRWGRPLAKKQKQTA